MLKNSFIIKFFKKQIYFNTFANKINMLIIILINFYFFFNIK